MNEPLISVVTPCLNRRSFVAAAVESVLCQHYPRFEHVVMDGGSTDGTLEVLARFPHLDVVSEKDENLYDAVNKAILRSRGDVIAFLNTDDVLPPDVLTDVGRAFAADPMLDAVYGGAAVVENDREIIRYTDNTAVRLSTRGLARRPGLVNARFFHRRVYDRVGLFDIRFPIASDLDFLLRAAQVPLRTTILPRVLYLYRQHAASLTFQSAGMPAKVARDTMNVVDHRIGDEALTAGQRRELTRLHGTYALGGLYSACRKRKWKDAASFACRGLRRDPFWPIAFAQAAFNVARRSLCG